jgi:hypothetical protein
MSIDLIDVGIVPKFTTVTAQSAPVTAAKFRDPRGGGGGGDGPMMIVNGDE